MANKSIKSFDVCIVGAGPVGLATAIALTQQGRRVCVVDAKNTIETPLTTWDSRIFALTPRPRIGCSRWVFGSSLMQSA